MAFKELEDYYNKTKTAYFTALNLCKEYDKEHKEGIVEDKDFKKFNKKINILKDRYETLAYFFLYWSMPSKEEKEENDTWMKEHKTELDYLKKRDADKILKNNNTILKGVKEYISTIKDNKNE